MNKSCAWKRVRVFVLLCLATAMGALAQTFTTIVNFNGSNGSTPYDSLVQGTDGNLYGTTGYGGAFGPNYGTVFRTTTGGTLTTLHSFSGTDGTVPYASLVLATNGAFYGTTFYGGANDTCTIGYPGCGTVFKITPGGSFTTLLSFSSTYGTSPQAGLIQATNGNFYGTALYGGINGLGTIFKITPAGTPTTLLSFDYTDGAYPLAALIQATNGNFYGATDLGGANGYGTIFEITPGGSLTTLHSFNLTDGEYAYAALIQGTDGNFYGTTEQGGANGYGTIFKITPGGTLNTLHSFDSTDGAVPFAPLVQGTDGNFYGTTTAGGTSSACSGGCGTVFKIAPGGTLTTVHSFDSTDGASPLGGLVQCTDGNFYGTTYTAGAQGFGTVFRLSVGLGPFIRTLPTSGKAGAAVKILGTNLTGATSVSFNGTVATFTVVSRYLITTTVPVGASSGKVRVVTPSGTLSSNVPFRVRP